MDTAAEQPVETLVDPYQPIQYTDEAGQPISLSKQEQADYRKASGLIDPMLDLSADDLFYLARNPTDPEKPLNIMSAWMARKDEITQDPEAVQRVSDAWDKYKESTGFKDLPNATELVQNVFGFAKGALKQAGTVLWNYPQRFFTSGEREAEVNRNLAEASAASEAGLAGLGHLAERVASKVTGGPATPQERVEKLFADTDRADQLKEIVTGQGRMLPEETAAKLKAAGFPVRPEEVEQMAAGDLLSLFAFGKAFGAAGRLVPGVVSTTAARAVTALGEKTAQVGGRAIEAAGAVAQKVLPKAAAVAPVAGAIKGATVGGAGGALWEGAALGYGAGKIAAKRLLKAVPQAKTIEEAGNQIAGKAVVKDAYTQLAKDLLESAPAAAYEVGKGAAFDVAFAATAETPEEAKGVGVGVLFGLLGGGARVGGHALSGQLIAPREAAALRTPVRSAGILPELEPVHQQSYNAAEPGVKTRVNALRSFVKSVFPDREFIYAARPEAGQPDPLVAQLTKLGMPEAQAKQWAGQAGVNTNDFQGKKLIIARDIEAAPHEAGHALENVLGESAMRSLDKIVQKDPQYARNWDLIAQRYSRAMTDAEGNRLWDPLAETWQDFVLRSSGWGSINAAEKLVGQDGLGPHPAGRAEQLFAAEVEKAPGATPEEKQLNAWKSVLTPEEQAEVANRYISREVLAENFDAIFKHTGGFSEVDNSLPARVARVLGSLVSYMGGEPLAGRASEFRGYPLSKELTGLQERAVGALRAGKPPEAPPTPKRKGAFGPPATPQDQQQAADDARVLAGEASTVAPEPGAQSPREVLGVLAEAMGGQNSVFIEGRSAAPGDPSAAISSNRTTRRAIIEVWRFMPDAAKALVQKLFFPTRVIKTKGGTYQVEGWSPEVLAANAQKAAEFFSRPEVQAQNLKLPEGLSLDPGTASFTPESWKLIFDSLDTFAANQRAGRTGSGEPLVVPKEVTETGGFAPPVRGEAKYLPQDMADFLNYLYNFKLPDTAIIRGGKTPLNVQGQRVSEATIPGRTVEPIEPRGVFGSYGKSIRTQEKQAQLAEDLGIAGTPVMEVNPFRQSVEATAKAVGKEPPSLFEVIQHLNVDGIKKVEHAPEQGPQIPANTLTLSAGFQPSKDPRAIKAAAIRHPKTGKIWEGLFHSDARQKAVHEGVSAYEAVGSEVGFTTNTPGEFLTRNQAFQRAQELSQLPEKLFFEKGGYLASEDLASQFQAPRVNAEPAEALPKLDAEKIRGGAVSQPHPIYRDAAAQEGNPWVRRDASPDNSDRTLLVQISNNLLDPSTRTGVKDEAARYYDKLYSGARPGFDRMQDFWEIPDWIAQASYFLPKSDLYVVRDVGAARRFLAEAEYGRVAFSALDINKGIIRELVQDYPGRVDVGGYVDPKTFADLPNVKWHDVISDLATEEGVPYRVGVDYSKFQGSDTIPRLTLSKGCKYKCAFCGQPKALVETPPEAVRQQADAIATLGSKLVYLNDKTFGQAKNYKSLVEVNHILKERNPDFQGFIIQTTASDLLKLPADFLKESGIKFVELGIESYNDPILNAMHKPATESVIDKATDKLRQAGIALIPNIIIGFPQETAQTYARTLAYLRNNKDIISHANIYNLGVFSETELGKQILTLGEADFDQNVLEKSFHTNPEVHRQFAGDVYGLAQQMLEGKPSAAQFAPSKAPGAIKEAAIRDPETGKVVSGVFHSDAISKSGWSGEALAAAEHGFVTNDGQFLLRDEAFKRAVELSQVSTGPLSLSEGQWLRAEQLGQPPEEVQKANKYWAQFQAPKELPENVTRIDELPATREELFKGAAVSDLLNRIDSSTQEEWTTWAKSGKGMSMAAHETGIAVRTPEELAQLKTTYETYSNLASLALKNDNLSQAAVLGNKAQAAGEAYISATGKNVAGQDYTSVLQQLHGRDYQPPLPGGKAPAGQFSPSNEPRAIRAAAVREKIGKKRIFTGFFHGAAYEAALDQGGPWRGKHYDTGFVTNEGEFLTREEAAVRAEEMGQLMEGQQNVEDAKKRGAGIEHLSMETLQRPEWGTKPMQFQPNKDERAIKSAAVRVAGRIFEGPVHAYAIEEAQNALGQKALWDNTIEDGFVTNSGEFLDRQEAYRRAAELKQINEADYEKAAYDRGATPAVIIDEPMEALAFRASRQFQPSDEPGAIKAAAIKNDKDGKIFTASWHFAAQQKAHDAGYPFTREGWTDGWVTNDGEFISRQEGIKRAERYGQMTPGRASEEEGLHSGDMDLQFQPPRKDFKGEQIKEAAIRLEDGSIYGGVTHAHAMRAAARAGALRIMSTGGNEPGFDDGFTTTRGRFVDREEAGRIAEQAQQLAQPLSYDVGTSENYRPALDALDLGQFQPSKDKRAIKAAAVQWGGRVFEGFTHADAQDEVWPYAIQKTLGKRVQQDELSGEEHDRVESAIIAGVRDGFVTNGGEFLNRDAAYERAVQLQQITKPQYRKAAVEAGLEPNAKYLESLAFDKSARQFQPSDEPGAIKEAAVRNDDTNEVFSGLMHGEAWLAAEEAKATTNQFNWTEGFVTNDGEFLNRAEASTRAYEMGQTRRKFGLGLEAMTFAAEQRQREEAGQFMPGERKDDWKLRSPRGGGGIYAYSKAWITPKGEPIQLGATLHHEWLNQNPDVRKKYGIPESDYEGPAGGEQARIKALQKGFARVNYGVANGALTIEARKKDWPIIAPAVERLVKENANKIDSMSVHLFDNAVTRVVEDETRALFRFSNKEKMDNLPLISAPRETTEMSPQASSAQYQPPQLFPSPQFDKELKKIRSGEAGGQTFLPSGDVWSAEGKKVDLVSLASVNVPLGQLTRGKLEQVLAKLSDLLEEKDLVAGVYAFSKSGKPTVSVDLNAVVPKKYRKNTLAFARDNDQVAIWDAEASKEVAAGGKGDTKLQSPGEILDALNLLTRGDPVDVAEILRENRTTEPIGEELSLPGMEGKKPLASATVANMTKADLATYYPESVVPRRRNEPISSDILNSPLYREAASDDEAVLAFSRKLVEFAKEWQDHPSYQAGLKWYSEFAPMLNKTMGKDAPIFAELLAGTSPQQPPAPNFAMALDALEGMKSGRFNKSITKFEEGLEKIKDGSWKPWIEKEIKAGRVEEPKGEPTAETFIKQWVKRHDILPRQSNGKLYSISSEAVLRVLARRWLRETAGLKTQNFVQNLLGTGHEATIDLWADRTMRRIGYAGSKERWRILPKNATGVSDADFKFAQKVFRSAAEELRVQPDSLQGGLWFAEKQHWADSGWSRLDLGDYRKELPKIGMLKRGIAQRTATQKAVGKAKTTEQPELLVEPRNLRP